MSDKKMGTCDEQVPDLYVRLMAAALVTRYIRNDAGALV
jgi:hypothetical protein